MSRSNPNETDDSKGAGVRWRAQERALSPSRVVKERAIAVNVQPPPVDTLDAWARAAGHERWGELSDRYRRILLVLWANRGEWLGRQEVTFRLADQKSLPPKLVYQHLVMLVKWGVVEQKMLGEKKAAWRVV